VRCVRWVVGSPNGVLLRVWGTVQTRKASGKQREAAEAETSEAAEEVEVDDSVEYLAVEFVVHVEVRLL
jgi:hypothetical protein